MGDKDKAADCPWCGPMRGHYGYTVGRFGTRLTCFCCDSHGPIAPTQDAALEAWNRRADIAAVQVRVKPIGEKGEAARIMVPAAMCLAPYIGTYEYIAASAIEPQPDPRDEVIARRCGAWHFHKGRAYADNPYGDYLQAKLHLAWSEGFNRARAASMLAARNSEGAR